jgi:undecaprenyl-diphosphatase
MKRSSFPFANTWQNNTWLRWAVALGIVIALTALFGELAEDVWFQEGFDWDPPLILAIHSLSTPWLDGAVRGITRLGFSGAILVTAAMCGWFLWQRRLLDAATVAVALVGGVILNLAIKVIFARPRPLLFAPLVEQGGFSFPSGHVAASVSVYGLLAVYLWRSGHRAPALAAAGVVPLVAFSRIYLGVHYPSDTLAAMAYATLWLWAVITIRDRQARRVRTNAPTITASSSREKVV